jgi:ABC-type transport system involved in multi-copper enzyme maturation permease subunit
VSARVDVNLLPASSAGANWALWLRQIGGILRLEVRKNFLGKRALPVYLLASLPVLLIALLAFTEDAMQRDVRMNFAKASEIFSNIHEGLILRTVIFFGCAWIFMNLFRGEVVDKSLHYYFLSAVRREVLVAGKYLAGLIASSFLFLYATAGAYFFLLWPLGFDGATGALFNGPAGRHALTYLGVTVLACAGYGALFLVIGLFFRNPVIPALIVYGWEWLNFLLPPLLKKISVIHYLHSLVPVAVNEGPFAVVGEPTPAWVTIPGLLLFTAAVLALASVRIRRMEVRYGGE